MKDGKATRRAPDHARARRRAHRRGRDRRRRGRRRSPRTIAASSRSTSRASACACSTSPAVRPTTCARSGSGSRATRRSTSSRSSSCARRPTTCTRRRTSSRSSPSPSTSSSAEHLPRFDAVVLQDFDAQPYGLEKSPAAARAATCARAAGSSWSAGRTRSSPAATRARRSPRCSPCARRQRRARPRRTPRRSCPTWTDGGRDGAAARAAARRRRRRAPADAGRERPRRRAPGRVVLWSHPHAHDEERRADAGARDRRRRRRPLDRARRRRRVAAQSSRSSARARRAAGTARCGTACSAGSCATHASSRRSSSSPGGCIAGHAGDSSRARAPVAKQGRPSTLDVTRIDEPRADPIHLERKSADLARRGRARAPAAAGRRLHGAARASARGPTTRRDFACEAGGDEWADSRPDAERLRALADATGGSFHFADDAGSIDLAEADGRQHRAPRRAARAAVGLDALAAVALGVHWFARRRSGLS